MTRMEILYQFNEKYAPYAGVSITSLLVNNRNADRIRIWVLGEKLEEASIKRLEDLAKKYQREIVFLETVSLVLEMKKMNMPAYRGSYAANMRLFLPKVLDETIDRVLYLDADTIVDRDIQELFALDMNMCPIGMVMDSLGDSHKLDIGLLKEDRYFNSGVLLFQMKEWRHQKLTEQIVDHVLHVRSQYPAPDQDLLNLICKGKIFTLPIQYNFQPTHMAFGAKQYQMVFHNPLYYSIKEIEDAENQISIYHTYRFMGKFPWDKNSEHPGEHIFNQYLSISPWEEYVKTGVNSSMFLKVELMLFHNLPRKAFLFLFKWSHRLYMIKANRESLKVNI